MVLSDFEMMSLARGRRSEAFYLQLQAVPDPRRKSRVDDEYDAFTTDVVSRKPRIVARCAAMVLWT
jgi:hypothetical protein